jgi:hypothetical protein
MLQSDRGMISVDEGARASHDGSLPAAADFRQALKNAADSNFLMLCGHAALA